MTSPLLTPPRSQVLRKGVSVPQGWDDTWRWALGQTATRLALIGIFGDSIGRGYSASTMANTWWKKLIVALQALHGDGGTGFFSSEMSTAFALAPVNAWPEAAAASGSGQTQWLPANSGYGGSTLVTATVNSTLTFPNLRGRDLTVHYQKYNTFGTFEVRVIQGATDVQLDAALSGTGAASLASKSYDLAVVAPTINSALPYNVVIKNLQAGGAVIDGITALNRSGVALSNFCKAGAGVALLSQGSFSGGSGANTYQWQTLGVNQLDLFINQMGINDRTTTNPNTDSATANSWRGLWQAAIDFGGLARAGTDPSHEPSILGISPLGVSSIDTGASPNGGRWQDFVMSVDRMCRANGWAHLNLHSWASRYDADAVARGFVASGDKVHPTDAFQDAIAKTLINTLS